MILNTYSVPFTAMDCQSIRLCYAVVGGAVNIKTRNPYIYIYMDKIKTKCGDSGLLIRNESEILKMGYR